MIYSGGENHRNGVGIVMKNSVAKSMMRFWAISGKVIMMKLEAKPFNINVMQVYAPTQDHDGEEIEKFYQEIQNGIKYAKSDEVICIMGDLNAKVGDERYQNIVGMHGLGRRNEKGERLIQNIYERLCIEETGQQPDNGSLNNQCDKKWTTVKQSIKSSLMQYSPERLTGKSRNG